jgi:hypothetical protein
MTPISPALVRLTTALGTRKESKELSGCQILVEDIVTCKTTAPFRLLTISVKMPVESSQ